MAPAPQRPPAQPPRCGYADTEATLAIRHPFIWLLVQRVFTEPAVNTRQRRSPGRINRPVRHPGWPQSLFGIRLLLAPFNSRKSSELHRESSSPKSSGRFTKTRFRRFTSTSPISKSSGEATAYRCLFGLLTKGLEAQSNVTRHVNQWHTHPLRPITTFTARASTAIEELSPQRNEGCHWQGTSARSHIHVTITL